LILGSACAILTNIRLIVVTCATGTVHSRSF